MKPQLAIFAFLLGYLHPIYAQVPKHVCSNARVYNYLDKVNPHPKEYEIEEWDMGKIAEYLHYYKDSTGKYIKNLQILSKDKEVIGTGSYLYDSLHRIVYARIYQWKKWDLFIDTIENNYYARWGYRACKEEEISMYEYKVEPYGRSKKETFLSGEGEVYTQIYHYNQEDSLMYMETNDSYQTYYTYYIYDKNKRKIAENFFYEGDSLCRLKQYQLHENGLPKSYLSYEDVPIYQDIRTLTLPGALPPAEKGFYYYDNDKLLQLESFRRNEKGEYKPCSTEMYSYDSKGRILTFCFENMAEIMTVEE